MYQGIDSTVFIYAPGGSDLKFHMERISSYNQRNENPTRWNSVVYTGSDFLDKMIFEKKGNVVVLAGNNRLKTEYIHRSISEGFNVLADKPMAINMEDFNLLKEAFQLAKEKNLLLYDIMTERFEITTILQKEFSQIPEIFGELEKGSTENPSVTKESVHHFYKFVSGSILTRPVWFFDVVQEGEGLVDVMTHLVDMVQWECFPGKIINIDENNSLGRMGKVNFSGVIKNVNLSYVPDANVDDYVIVHVGFALNKVDTEEAEKLFDYMKQINEYSKEELGGKES